MYRDTSIITSTDCAIITDDQTILSYNGTTLNTYKLLSNKYYLSSSASTTAYSGGSYCYSVSQLNTLPSRYDFITPVYHLMAIISVIFIFWAGYRLIIYPWFRRSL